MHLVEDRELLEAYRRGDRAALERVYRAYAPKVAGMLRGGFSFASGGRTCRFHGVRSQFDLEDRMQEVFSRAFSERARLGYDGLTPFATYLSSITRNLIIDDFRKKERALVEYSIETPEPADDSPEEHASEPLLGAASPTGRPDADRARAELLELVEAFKATLKDRERTVYALRFERELEHRDIAAETGLSPSKIKTSEARIRTDFFRFMQRHGYFAGYQQHRRGWLRFLRGT